MTRRLRLLVYCRCTTGSSWTCRVSASRCLKAAFLRVVAPKPPPQVMHTPGHTSDSICLWHASSRTLLCADTVLGWGSTTVGDLGDYMQSLEALRALQPQPLALLPGHGPPIVPLQQQQKGTTPVQLIQQYIDHRSARIAQA